jgi:curli biogenesis system outer membrane secretion channel CsgG
MLKRTILLGLLTVALLSSTALAQDKQSTGDTAVKGKYQEIEVTTFDAKEGVVVPEGFLKTLMATVVTELQKTKKFKQVLREGETPATMATMPAPAGATPANAGEGTLRLTGTITKFKAGSRAKRYLVGFGAGKSKVIAHIKFTDKATGSVLFEQDVDGDVVMGLFGGDSGGATRELAEAVAKSAKKRFF